MGANESSLSSPSHYLKIGRYYITRLSGINFFSYLKPKKEYLRNPHVPLVMCMGESHLSYSPFSFYTGECEDCQLPSCVDMEKKELFEIVLEELYARNIVDIPFDVYTETSYFDYKKSGNESGKLGRMYEYARELNIRYPNRIRSHSNDPRHPRKKDEKDTEWYEAELSNYREWTTESIEFLHHLIPAFRGDYRSAVDFFFSRISSKSKSSVLWKEFSKQDPHFLAADGRPMTDLSVWADVFEILLRIHFDLQKFSLLSEEDYMEILEKVKPGDPIDVNKVTSLTKSTDKEDKDEKFLFMLSVVGLASMLDLYQLARMFKMQCVSSTSECVPSYAMLAMIITGSRHSQTISSVLTNPSSPLCFYTTDLRIHNILYEDSHSFSKMYNRDRELIDCVDFTLHHRSIDLIRDIQLWIDPNRYDGRRNARGRGGDDRQIVRAARRASFKKSDDFDDYLKNDSILVYKPLPFKELLTTMPLEHLM